MSYTKVAAGAANLLIICLLGLPILLFFLIGEPYQRGFFCNDETIAHPYIASTLPSLVLYLTCFLIPLAVIAGTEVAVKRGRPPAAIPFGRYVLHVPAHFAGMYTAYVGYLLGAATSQCLTDLAKYTIGRLRPHFLDVCRPDWSAIDCEVDGRPVFVTNYTCLGNTDLFEGDELEHRIKETHLSFPSGHASFSMQAMIFVILYLQARLVLKRVPSSTFLVPLAQVCLFAFAIYTSFTRVSDYKHNAGDVIGGALLGAAVQIFNVVYVQKMFENDEGAEPVGQQEEEIRINERTQSNYHASSNGIA